MKKISDETASDRCLKDREGVTVTYRQKILIVDDKEQNLYALERVLENAGSDTVRATNGNDALIACLNHEFALAILDVQMPGMDGYELAEFLREDERTGNLPIIFLSAVYSDEHHVFKGYRAGAVDFLTKPYRPEILLAKVRIFLQLDHQRRRQDLLTRQRQVWLRGPKFS